MDYTVGSLADLISGLNTPNKPKVIKKKFKKISETDVENVDYFTKEDVTPDVIDNVTTNTSNKASKKGSPVLKKNKVKRKTNKSIEIETVEEDTLPGGKLGTEPKTRKNKKRQLKEDETDTNAEEGSPPKKKKLSQNEENAERRIKKKTKEERVQNPEEMARTIFVGNIPIMCTKKKIKKLFKKYGQIENMRIRGIPVANLNTPKKVAAIKKEFNPQRSNVYCYIRFMDKESALKAEAENGSLFEEHHLRVHCCMSKEKPDETRAIFVGNLSFRAVEDDLWKLFEPCGPISYVRIVRDSHTGMGKGFGYVNFKDSDAVQLALEMENVKLNDRELRISLCNLNTARKNKKHNKNKKITQPGKQKGKRRLNTHLEKETSAGAQDKTKQMNTEFQGTKFTDKKKKNKFHKGLLEKKKLVKKIAPNLSKTF